jgi:hypothetical protein
MEVHLGNVGLGSAFKIIRDVTVNLTGGAYLAEILRRYVLTLLIINVFSAASSAYADTWVDVDGDTFVTIDNEILSVYSTGSFYYFDQLFTAVRQGDLLRVCVGFSSGPGMATDCLGSFVPIAGFNNEGKNRSLHFGISNFEFVFTAFEDYLRDDREMKISIDNGDLFSAFSLRRDYELTEDAQKILKLPD